MSAEHISAIADVIAAVAAVMAVVIAHQQLRQVNRSLRHGSLATLLSLESEMNTRKQEVEKCSHDFFKLVASNAAPDEIDSAYRHLEGCFESWLNSVDRFAYCILKKLLRERDWKPEYLPYLRKLLQDHPERFGRGTIYNNCRRLAIRWNIPVPQ